MLSVQLCTVHSRTATCIPASQFDDAWSLPLRNTSNSFGIPDQSRKQPPPKRNIRCRGLPCTVRRPELRFQKFSVIYSDHGSPARVIAEHPLLAQRRQWPWTVLSEKTRTSRRKFQPAVRPLQHIPLFPIFTTFAGVSPNDHHMPSLPISPNRNHGLR